MKTTKRKYKIESMPRYYVDEFYFIDGSAGRDRVFVPEFQSDAGDWVMFKKDGFWFIDPPTVFFKTQEEAESFIKNEHAKFVSFLKEDCGVECVKEFELG